MLNLFNDFFSGISGNDLQKYLNNCTIKIVENGKTLVDIENGVNKLAPEKPKDRDAELPFDVIVHNNMYHIPEVKRENCESGVYHLRMLTADESGISNKQLITVLMDRFRNNPDKVALLKQLL